jgi:hypothetical protein
MSFQQAAWQYLVHSGGETNLPDFTNLSDLLCSFGALFHLADFGKLPAKNVERIPLGRAELAEIDVLEDDLERVADMTELAPVTPDLVEDGLLRLRVRTLAEIDIDEPKLCTLLIECPGIDRLP